MGRLYVLVNPAHEQQIPGDKDHYIFTRVKSSNTAQPIRLFFTKTDSGDLLNKRLPKGKQRFQFTQPIV
jgi:hypothetical protein